MAEVKTTDKTKLITKNAQNRVREGLLIVFICIALFLLLALVTYHRNDPSWSTLSSSTQIANAGGRVGAWIADFVLYFFGYVAYLFPFLLAGLAWMVFYHNSEQEKSTILWHVLKLVGAIFFLIGACGLLTLFITSQEGVPLTAGGVLGELIAPSFVNTFNTIGASLILVALLLVGITLMFGVSWIGVTTLTLRHTAERIIQWWQNRREQRLALAEQAPPPIMQSVETIEQPPVINKKPVVKKVKQKPAKPAKQIIRERAKQIDADLSQDQKGDLPSINLLDQPDTNQKYGFTASELEQLSQSVEQRLAEFGIPVKVTAVLPGPVVTRFELELAPGMKAGKITALAKDLARSLSFPSVRVVEVIPGKAVVGLEVPNAKRKVVRLREVLESNAYQHAESVLSLGLGKDIAGHSVVTNVEKMPHLLVAGTTGAGKSVSLNAMILSILLKATPQQVRFIMIDPKMLELSIYEGIPHLLAPVVTNMKEAANALKWCVAEMDRRYRLMAALSVRNLASFNSKVIAANKAGKPIKDPFFVSGDESEKAPDLMPLPKIVVVVDELADMMMVVGKKVEELIARIAQKARAAGIHMILATQRPSVDVITGLIKANVPSRIAFNVSSRVDSRTILDQQGAEHLLGHGDMLYLPPGTSLPIRVHGAFVADEEVVRIVAAWKKRAEPEYLDEVIEGKVENTDAVAGLGFDDDGDNEQDPLYDKAVAIVLETRRASISSIQRRLKIGYNRAARMMETMEEAGVVSPMESNGSREVLAPPPPKE